MPKSEAMSASVYDRVVIIGVDGMGAFNSIVATPQMDRIFLDGAVTYSMQSTIPSISGPSWGTMFYGVDPHVHKWDNDLMLVNANVAVELNKNSNLMKSGYTYKNPENIHSLFDVIASNFPVEQKAGVGDGCSRVRKKNVVAIINWYSIFAFIEADNARTRVHMDADNNDSLVKEKVLRYLDAGCDFKFLYVHLDEVDRLGHKYGPDDERYRRQITAEDGYIGEIYDKLVERKMKENTLFVVMPDHGQKTPEGGHGGTSCAEMDCFLGIAGRTVVCKGQIGEATVKDIPFVVAKALGFPPEPYWTGKLPKGIFVD